jgi:hypothetical protein
MDDAVQRVTSLDPIFTPYKEALRRASPAGSTEALVKAEIMPRRTVKGLVEPHSTVFT